MLVRRYGPQRAAEIVGDIYEQYGPSGLSWRIAAIAITMNCRWIAAIFLPGVITVTPRVIALGHANILSTYFFWMMSVIQKLHLFQDNPSGHVWFNVLSVIASVSWSVSLLCAIRYGISDRMARVGLVLSCLLTVDVLFSFHLYLRLSTSGLVLLAVCILFCRNEMGARALWSLLMMAAAEVIALEVQLGSGLPGYFIFAWAHRHRFDSHPHIIHWFVALATLSDVLHWTIAAAFAAWVMTLSRRWLLLEEEATLNNI